MVIQRKVLKEENHCFYYTWNKFTQMNNTAIITKAVEKDDDRALVKRYGVEGFPTILLLDSNGKKLDTYSGDRNAQGLLDYCKKNS